MQQIIFELIIHPYSVRIKDLRTSRRLAIIGEVNIDKANFIEAATIDVNIDEENITIHEANIGKFHVSRFFSVKDKYHFSSFKKHFEILIQKKDWVFLTERGAGLTSVFFFLF